MFLPVPDQRIGQLTGKKPRRLLLPALEIIVEKQVEQQEAPRPFDQRKDRIEDMLLAVPVAIVVTLLITLVIAGVIGAICVRLKEIYFAFVTLAFSTQRLSPSM